MQLRDMFFSCLRRWYFVVAGLLLTAVGTYAVYTTVHPTYDAKASVVLIPPKVAVTTGDNPYLYLGGLDQALGVLQVKISSPEVSGDLVKHYPGGVLTVTRDTTTTGPILAITATADDAASSMKLLQGAEDLVPSTLATLQSQLKVPADSVITSMNLSTDDVPTKVNKKQIQTMAMVGVGGAAATIILVGLLDRLLARRSQRKLAARAEAAETEAAQADAARAEEAREAEQDEPDQADAGTVSLFRERSAERNRARVAWLARAQGQHTEPIDADDQSAEGLDPVSLDDARP